MSLTDLFANGKKPNILIITTDQQRSILEWPASYQQTLLDGMPAMQRLMANGLTFENIYTASCACTPSRGAFLTSRYPAVTGCVRTSVSTLPEPESFPNFATVLKAAGYTSYWTGKWHLLGVETPGTLPNELQYAGFELYKVGPDEITSWDPPDAGTTLNATFLAGGTQGPTKTNRNDPRYLGDAQAFLANPPKGPWCLVASFVNPHDVHIGFLANQSGSAQLSFDQFYYDKSNYENLAAPLPSSVNQSIENMPRGQRYVSWRPESTNWDGGLATLDATPENYQNFANFYVYLLQYVDNQINTLLESLSSDQIQDTLIIRFADHGEMGLSHGLVEKMVAPYKEATHIPLIFSNPVAFPTPQSTTALASTIDLTPTLASLLGVSNQFPDFSGKDLTPILNDPTKSVQDFVHFTYDDVPVETPASAYGPSVIRTVRSRDWVYSVYMNSVDCAANGYTDADWEMYDLNSDPNETNNLAGQNHKMQALLDQELQKLMKANGTQPAWYPQHWPPTAGSNSVGGPPPELSMTYTLNQVPGIPANMVKQLNYIGVDHSDALLQRASTPAKRQYLLDALAVDEKDFDAWVEASRMLRLPGLGPQQLERLIFAGITSLADLGKLSTTNPPSALSSTQGKGVAIDPSEIQSWIAHAKGSP